nr:coiled-coil domain-containing protein 81-like isoform X2 [Halyomorpha halys]
MNSVWNQIAQQVKKCLEQEKSIIIKEVGTFTLQKWKLDAGIQHEVNFFQPMFFLSKTLTEQYDLHQRKEYATDSMPVTVLNLCKVMKTCNYKKETVLLCLDEIVQCLRYMIADGKDIKLEFPGLGELKIINTVATFEFYQDMKPDEKVPEKPCHRYQIAMKPYIKKVTCPCAVHDSAYFENY